MNASGEAKIIMTGPPGVGKTTAIRLVSELPVITAKAANREETTGAPDASEGVVCGELQVDENLVLRLYGAGGSYYHNDWDWLAQDALGFLIFIDNASAAPLAALSLYLDCFQAHIKTASAVIVVTHTESAAQPTAAAYYELLKDRHVFYPVVSADVRQPKDVLGVLDLLLLSLEQA